MGLHLQAQRTGEEEKQVNPLIGIRLECLRLASQDIAYGTQAIRPNTDHVLATAKAYEKLVRRGIRIADLGGGCGCGGKSNTGEAKRKRQQLLLENAKALIDLRIEPMTLSQLVTDYDLMFTPADAHRIDVALRKYQLRRNVTGDDLAKWIETGLLPGGKGKPYTP